MSTNQTIQPSCIDHDVVIYDGECNFCTSMIGTLKRLDSRGALRYLSLHDPSVRVDYPDLTHEMLMAEMWLVTRDGRRYTGADSVRYLSGKLPLLYPIAPLLYLPFCMPLWRWLYRVVARNRYRLAGRKCTDGACRLHGR
ncbi:MAG: DUF393 domain-containing protein [Pirellulaceae bacterium]|nr:DUF393 domain-containing protein [Pirellulaceae bacterium]